MGFLDSNLLAMYYTGLSYETIEDYEQATEILSGISLYRDVSERLSGYPEKIRARDYAAADQAEQQGYLEKALEGFQALNNYLDSPDRVKALQSKIAERDAAAAEKARADAYTAADRAEAKEDYATAYAGFKALGNYKDSAARAETVQNKGNYARAMQYVMDGEFSRAYELFTQLGNFEDSEEKAYVLGITTFAEEVSDRGNGVAAFRFHDTWGIMNVNTGANASPVWDEIGLFNDYGLAPVVQNGLKGYINTSGEIVIPCEWYDISDFTRDGLCTVAKMETRRLDYSTYYSFYFGLYDFTGNEITPATWIQLGFSANSDWGQNRNSCFLQSPDFADGKIKVQNKQGKFGFIDKQGKLVGEVRWDSVQPFSESLAVVEEKGKYGYIDRECNIAIEPQYEAAQSFSENLAAVKTNGLWQFIDHDNQVVIAPRYGAARPFKGSTADAWLPGVGWQVIDKSGTLVYFVSQKTADEYARAQSLLEAGNYDEAYALFMKLLGYKDAEILSKETKYQKAAFLRESGEFDQARTIFAEIEEYSDAAEQIFVTYYVEGESKRAAENWEGAVQAFEKAGDYTDAAEQIYATYYREGEVKRTAEDWEGAVQAFGKAGDYADAAEQIYVTYYSEGETKRASADWEGAVKAFKKAGDYADAEEQIYATYYAEGIADRDAGNFADALKAFEKAGGYSDAEEQIGAIYYAEGKKMRAAEDWEGAVREFEKAGTYLDAAEQVKATYYLEGLTKRVRKDWNGAVQAFEQAGEYLDAAEQVKATYYAEGEAKRAREDWEGAVQAFEKAGKYSDAAEQVKATYYAEGEAKRTREDWKGAVHAFENAGGYSDAAEQIKATYYAEGEAKRAHEDWVGAIQAFGNAGEYLDASTQKNETIYLQAKALSASGEITFAILALESIKGYKDSDDILTELQGKVHLERFMKVGNIVTFGKYEQDNNKRNGTEDIEWIVIDVKDGKSLLLSRYGLDAKPYNSRKTGITWEKCSLRKWLNSTFVSNAFSRKEQAALLKTAVDNSRKQNNGEWNTPGGNNTEDRVFLLSCQEVNDLYVSRQELTECVPTEYATAQGAWKSAQGKAWWWLRSPAINQNNAVIVNGDGSHSYRSVNYGLVCVRPAFWLDLESIEE